MASRSPQSTTEKLRANFRVVSAQLAQHEMTPKNLHDLVKEFIVGADLQLLNEAVRIAQGQVNVIHRTNKKRDQKPNYSIEVACVVASHVLDPFSPTKIESVLAALMQDTIAAQPASTQKMRTDLEAFASRSNPLVREARMQAIKEAFWIAEQVARITASPRDYALTAVTRKTGANAPFLRLQGALMAMESVRAIRVKQSEALVRAIRIDDVRDVKEKEKIAIILDRAHGPSMEVTGWHDGARAVQDFLLRQRDPKEFERVTNEVKRQYGPNIYEREREIIGFAERYIGDHINLFAEKNGFVAEVYGRLKSVSSTSRKIQNRRSQAENPKPNYDVADMNDIIGLHVVLYRRGDGDGRANEYNDHILCLNGNAKMPQTLNPVEMDTKPLFGVQKRPEQSEAYRALHTAYHWPKKAFRVRDQHVQNEILPYLEGKTFEVKFFTEDMLKRMERETAHHIYKLPGGLKGISRQEITEFADRVKQVTLHLAERFETAHPTQIVAAKNIYAFRKNGTPVKLAKDLYAGVRNGDTVPDMKSLERIRPCRKTPLTNQKPKVDA